MGVLDVLGGAVESDDAAGCELIGMVVYDFMADLAELNREEIGKAFALWGLDRVQVAKRALARSYVESVAVGDYPDEGEALATARWLAGLERFVADAADGLVTVSKAPEIWTFEGQRRQVDVARDARGRFARGVSTSRSVSLENLRDNENRAAPRLKAKIRDGRWQDDDDDWQALYANHQGNWESAGSAALSLKDAWESANGSKGTDGVDVQATILHDDGSMRAVRVPLKSVQGREGGGLNIERGLAPDLEEQIVMVELVPSRGKAGDAVAGKLAEFNALGSVGGEALASLAFTDPELRGRLASSLKMSGNPDDGALSRLFGVLSAGGRVLQGVTGFERLGEMAHLVGVLGPQAEEVLGPYVKRSAYRYRGTETTPDEQLRRSLEPAPGPAGDAMRQDWEVVGSLAEGTLSMGQVRDARNSPLIADAMRWRAEGLSEDSLLMQVRADEASVMLAQTLPRDPFIARLSVASGQVLPSQGVIIDADGRVVSQSVGFTDDHYLPFDLTNLARLRGGQYVRTRQQGGLTGEDIYTAVMTGTRQVQVVSSSGVFTLEFAPDFRGARANSDKARGMYDRYLKILDAVSRSGLYLQDVDAATVRRLRNDADRMFPGDRNAEQRESHFQGLLAAERAKLTEVDEAALVSQALSDIGAKRLEGEPDEAVVARLRGSDRRKFDNRYEDLLDEASSQLTNRLRLNGEGYEVALQTLQAQFPYFIRRVSRQDLEDLPYGGRVDRPRGAKFSEDRGYVLPGSLRSRSVRSGFRERGPLEPLPYNPQWSDRVVEPKPSAPETQPDAGKAPADAGRAPAAARAASVPSAASGRVASRLDAKMRVDVDDLTKNMALLNPDWSKRVSAEERQELIDDALGEPDRRTRSRMLADLALRSNATQLSEMIREPAVLDGLLDGMRDQAGVYADVVAQLIDENGGPGVLDSKQPFGYDSVGDVQAAVIDSMESILDVALMRDLQEPLPSDGLSDMAGMKNSRPLAFPDISRLGSVAEAERFAASNPELERLSRSLLGVDDNLDGDWVSLPTLASNARNGLDALSELASAQEDFRDALRANPGERPGQYLPMDDAAHTYSELFLDGSPLSDGDFASTDFQQKALLLQQAWDLAAVSRLLTTVEAGEVFPPKARRRLFKAASLSGQTSRLTVLDPGDPWSVEVAKALGVWRAA